MVKRLALFALLASVAFASPAAAAEFTGWVPAGKLRLGRSEPSATRLGDGRVLLTGGQAPVEIVAATELYDPAANTWTAAAPMTDARLWATAVTLADGRALVAGGIQDADAIRPLFTGEVFDPRTGKWTPTGRLNAHHARGKAVVLKDGRVLLVGASGDPRDGLLGYDPMLGAEIYDPSTNAWTLTGPMHVSRTSPAVALLHDGRVLVAGSSPGIGAETEIYDPASDSWTVVAPMSRARGGAEATTLADGRVLVAGGDSPYLDGTIGWEALTTAEVFDPATGTWAPSGSTTEQRGGDAAMATLADGRAIFAGGNTFDRPVPSGPWSWEIKSRPNTVAEVFDATSGTWSTTAPTLYPHSDHVAVGLLDGSLLVAGGYDSKTERLLPAATATPEPEATATPEPEATATPAPQPAPRPGPSSSHDAPPERTPSTHHDTLGRLAFSVLPKRLKPSRTGLISVRLRCGESGACRDRLTVKRGRATLLRRTVTLAAGGTATLQLKLPAAIRRALRKRPVPLTLELMTANAKRSVSVRR